MDQKMFGRYAADLKRLGADGKGTPELELERRGKYLLQYIPFEHVNREAKLVIVGITPGPNQLGLAYDAARKLLQAGRTESEILVEVKKVGAFGSSTMRPNLLKMLRHFRFEKILEIDDVESLWDKDAGLLHATSVIPHAAFTISNLDNKMFAGSFDEVMKSDLFRECFLDCFVPSITEINLNAFYVGLGQCPEAALQWCVNKGYLRQEQFLGAFCHPSTSGGSATSYYLREVTKEELKPTNPVRNRCDWLDNAYQQMKDATSLLLGEAILAPISVNKLSASIIKNPIINTKASIKDKLEKLTARTTSLSGRAEITAILSIFEKEGFELTKETKKLAEFQCPGGQIIYLVKTTSNPNNINVMVHPELKPEVIRMLDGVSLVSNEHRFHSNMTRFPKRLNRGQTETAYGWQVNINTYGNLPSFLIAFKGMGIQKLK